MIIFQINMIYILIISIILIILIIYYKNKDIFITLEDKHLNCDNLDLLSDETDFNYKWIQGYEYNSEKFKEGKFKSNLSKDIQRKKTLNILKYFHEACEKSNVKMYISHGTLLGAYRHKGFIPWDDDIDTTIFKEYVDIIHSKEFAKLLPSNIKIMKGYLPCNSPLYRNYCKFKNFNLNIKHNNNDFSICKNINNGVYIDIFHLNSLEQNGKIYYDLTCRGLPNTMIDEKTKNDMEPFKKIKFEGYYFNAPNNTKKILCTLYNRSINIEGKLIDGKYIINDNANKGNDPNNNLIKGDIYMDDKMNIKRI